MAMSAFKKIYVSAAASLALGGGVTYGYGYHQQHTTLKSAYATAAHCQLKNSKNEACTQEELDAGSTKQANENIKAIGVGAAGGSALMVFGLML